MSSPEYDVIVLGYGSAGGNAALQAAKMGAKVLILEKEDQPSGNSFVSSANMTMPTDFHKKSKEDGQKFAQYLEEIAQGTTPKSVIDAFVEGLYELPAWLEELGGEFEENKFERMYTYYIPGITFPKLESAKGLETKVYDIKQTERCPAPTAGRRVWELIDSHLLELPNVTIRTGVNAHKINHSHGGAVTGVTLSDDSTVSSRAVIMACGGFENDGLKRDLLGPRNIGLLGSPTNTGDGIRLAEKVGAKFWHHSAEASVLGFLPPDSQHGFALALRHPGFIFVNKAGQRFINESKFESHRGHSDTAALDHETGTYANDPIWLIMDQDDIKRNKKPVLEIFSYQVIRLGYKWSDHSVKEIQKGWIKRAESVEQLAEVTGRPLDTLKETLRIYNTAAEEGAPDPFGRDKDSIQAIHPPFYAMTLTPMLYNTQGGPQRNENAEIVDPDGNGITGLYGAGECGSIWGHAYQSSTNFSETIIFGRIAGREAAALAGKTDVDVKGAEGTEAVRDDPPTKLPEDQFSRRSRCRGCEFV